MDGDFVRGLRSRGIDVITAADAGMIRRKDEEHLSLAAMQGRALYSFLAQQKRYSTGEQIRRLVRLIGSLTDEAMKNREEFLGRW